MFNNISYNVVIERFKVFAGGHYLIKRFSHGQVDQTDLDKDQQFPWMHVAPVEVRAAAGARLFTFDVIFADIPRDKEDKTDYQKESISDMIRLAEDLLSEIQNGLTVFGSDVEVEGESTITPFIEEWTHTLSGCTLALTISVPNNYSACDIPADWAIGGGSPSTPPSPLPGIILRVNTVDNVNQHLLDLTAGANVTITDLGDGRVQFDATGDIGTNWGTIGGLLSDQSDLWSALLLKADILSLGAVAFSNDYNDLDNLPTIPSELDDLTDVNAPTPSNGQVLTWNGTEWVAQTPATGSGTVTSVGLSVPAPANAAFTVSGSPVITSGTLTIGANGTSSQYVDGTGALQTMPTGLPPTGAAGGDLSGSYPNPNVDRVHGIDFQSGTPSTGDVWLYEGSPAKWQHQQLPAVHVGNDSAVTGSTVKDALNHLNTTKVEANAAITAGTATKVTYDAKGLITSGTTLAASDLPTGIDAAKIGAGTVSNTEFGYLDGVTSALQTQLNAKEPTITAGTTSQYYRGDKTFQTLDKSAVGLSNVDNTSDLNKPISTATQTALNAKQDTLVSGTNIKTVNSTSLLGSGNVAVGTVTSVGGTGTVAGISLSGTVTGSGNLTLGGTLAVPVANITAMGTPSATTFLRGDGSWQAPAPAVSTMVFSSQMTVTQGANSTAYWAITGSNVPNVTENLRSVVMPVSGTLKNFYVRIGGAQSATGSLVFTLRKNSVSQAITVTFTNADGSNVTKSDTTNSFSVAAGDLITIQGVNNAPSSASATVISFSIILER